MLPVFVQHLGVFFCEVGELGPRTSLEPPPFLIIDGTPDETKHTSKTTKTVSQTYRLDAFINMLPLFLSIILGFENQQPHKFNPLALSID